MTSCKQCNDADKARLLKKDGPRRILKSAGPNPMQDHNFPAPLFEDDI